MQNIPAERQQKMAVSLAYGSTIPFLVLTLMSFLQIAPGFALQAMVFYSLGIICFIGGTWWGFSLFMSDVEERWRVALLLTSNVMVLVAVAIVLLASPLVAVFSLAAVYVLVMFIERRVPGLSGQPDYYRTLRARVSMIAAGSHLLFGWAISAL